MLVLDTCRGFGRWSSTSLWSGRMTVEESGRSKGKEAESADKFPAGMRVLAVDDDPICLKLLENLLLHCHYDVLSANGDTKSVMEGITHGACDYLLKPIRIEQLKNIWQHVVRRKKFDSRYQNKGESTLKAQLPNSEGVQGPRDHSGKLNRKRKGQMEEDEVHSEKNKT